MPECEEKEKKFEKTDPTILIYWNIPWTMLVK
jgi:hypothetical protein